MIFSRRNFWAQLKIQIIAIEGNLFAFHLFQFFELFGRKAFYQLVPGVVEEFEGQFLELFRIFFLHNILVAQFFGFFDYPWAEGFYFLELFLGKLELVGNFRVEKDLDFPRS